MVKNTEEQAVCVNAVDVTKCNNTADNRAKVTYKLTTPQRKQKGNRQRNYLGFEIVYPIDAKMGRPIFTSTSSMNT